MSIFSNGTDWNLDLGGNRQRRHREPNWIVRERPNGSTWKTLALHMIVCVEAWLRYRDATRTGHANDMRQILYFSVAVRPMSDDDLRTLLDQSWANNLDHGITGLLLYAGQHFIQAIEGKPDEVGQLISNIKADDRNYKVTLMLDRNIEQRAFPGWLMGFHAMSEEELRNVEGFRNLATFADIDDFESADEWLLNFMTAFYLNNSGMA